MIRAGWEVAEAEQVPFPLHAECAFAMGTRAGAAILDLDSGVIEPGKLADLVAVNLDDPSLHPRTDLLKAVVYAMSSRAVSDVWVHGRQVVASGRLTTVDERELLARVTELTKGWSISTAAR